MKRFWPGLLLVFPSLVFAATPRTFGELVTIVVNIVNALTALMVVGALVAYLYNIAGGVASVGEKRTQMRNTILWGILALFLMVSIWGILRLLQTTLFGDASSS